jgi:hypothetical protein
VLHAFTCNPGCSEKRRSRREDALVANGNNLSPKAVYSSLPKLERPHAIQFSKTNQSPLMPVQSQGDTTAPSAPKPTVVLMNSQEKGRYERLRKRSRGPKKAPVGKHVSSDSDPAETAFADLQ